MKITVRITGMHCASCARKIEQAVGHVKGVKQAVVNYATEKATVDFDEQITEKKHIQEAVRKVGYGVGGIEDLGILHLRIIGMDNQHCVKTIEGVLEGLHGILSYNLKTNEKAVINYDPKTNTFPCSPDANTSQSKIAATPISHIFKLTEKKSLKLVLNLFLKKTAIKTAILFMIWNFTNEYHTKGSKK